MRVLPASGDSAAVVRSPWRAEAHELLPPAEVEVISGLLPAARFGE